MRSGSETGLEAAGRRAWSSGPGHNLQRKALCGCCWIAGEVAAQTSSNPKTSAPKKARAGMSEEGRRRVAEAQKKTLGEAQEGSQSSREVREEAGRVHVSATLPRRRLPRNVSRAEKRQQQTYAPDRLLWARTDKVSFSTVCQVGLPSRIAD